MEDFKRFSVARKKNILNIWRISQGRVIDHKDVKVWELEQWDVLERNYGDKGLAIGCDQNTPLTPLRDAQPPPLTVRAEFSPAEPYFTKTIYDALGFPIDIPDGYSLKSYWFYCVVKQLTDLTGVCTHADLAHAMWPPNLKELPPSDVLKVYACHVKKRLAVDQSPDQLETLWGRGYRITRALSSPLQAA